MANTKSSRSQYIDLEYLSSMNGIGQYTNRHHLHVSYSVTHAYLIIMNEYSEVQMYM